jgi:hypothetical protein
MSCWSGGGGCWNSAVEELADDTLELVAFLELG